VSERDWRDGPPEDRQESVLDPPEDSHSELVPPPEPEPELASVAPSVEEAAVEEAAVEEPAPPSEESVVSTQSPPENGRPPAEHAEGDFAVPPGYGVLEGAPNGTRRSVGIVVSRFNGAVTSKLLEGALAELEDAGVARDAITVMPVPGAFELPLAAMALAKTRRYACIVALGCIIRGDTPHFDFVAGEAASGLQLAALETGVPVSFGVLTLDLAAQADDRLEKGAEAVRTGLEMADVFSQLRAAAAR
jgi:6,7-dimethyl-8-ribityllumazine synthase